MRQLCATENIGFVHVALRYEAFVIPLFWNKWFGLIACTIGDKFQSFCNNCIILFKVTMVEHCGKYIQYHEPMSRSMQLPHFVTSLCPGLFTDWSIFSLTFLLWKKGSSAPVTQWRQLVSFDWSWHSQESLVPGNFELNINPSMKTPWQKCSRVACFYSSAPEST